MVSPLSSSPSSSSLSSSSIATAIGSVSIGVDSAVKVMGVINASPESFYKGSVRTGEKEIAAAAREMQESGAQLIDVGAMSTAPYLETAVSAEQEIERMTAAIRAVKRACSLPVSADTPRAEVARQAIAAGADAINDVTGLKYDPEMAGVVAEAGVPVIVGAYIPSGSGTDKNNSKNRNKNKQNRPAAITGDLHDTLAALRESIAIARKAGIQSGGKRENAIIVDPSIGFFRSDGRNPFFTKTATVTATTTTTAAATAAGGYEKNDERGKREGRERRRYVDAALPWYVRDIQVLSELGRLVELAPVCVSVSRKSFIGHLLGLPRPEDRLVPSIACEIVAALNGASLIRTHSVKETVQALTILQLLSRAPAG